MGKTTSMAISAAAHQAERSRWAAVLLGAALLVTVSLSLAKTVVIATALTWREPLPKLRHRVRAVLATVAVLGTVMVCTVASNWLRVHAPGLGLTAMLVLAPHVGGRLVAGVRPATSPPGGPALVGAAARGAACSGSAPRPSTWSSCCT